MSWSLLHFREDYLNYRDAVALRIFLLLGIFLFHAGLARFEEESKSQAT